MTRQRKTSANIYLDHIQHATYET